MSCIDDYPEPEVIVSKEDSNEDTPGSGRTKLTFRLKEGRMRNPVLLLPQSFVFPKGDSSYETTKKPSMFLFGNEFAIKVGMLLSFATPSSCYSGNVFRDLGQRHIAIAFNWPGYTLPTDYSTKRLAYVGPEPVRRSSVQTPKKPPSSRGSNKPKSSGSRSTKPLSTSSARPIEDPHDVKFILERLHKLEDSESNCWQNEKDIKIDPKFTDWDLREGDCYSELRAYALVPTHKEVISELDGSEVWVYQVIFCRH
ncbi:hypothetical protein PNOK_0782500 [Pyrrhoderma noxium]|uniref:Uncharacterized protein n=1 Tax=Pyrrhoderma noxium TaxID=2282107 RepID=A0A286U9G4_9AGAM|nr:hypothetical protein PNOK_0782500 [Pyrrhoderma noxium]